MKMTLKIVFRIVLAGSIVYGVLGCASGTPAGSGNATDPLAAGGATTIYTVQQASGAYSILEFPVTAAGVTKPAATLTPSGISSIQTVATDSTGQIYVGVLTTTGLPEILVYPAGSSGSPAPSRTIIGSFSAGAGTFTETSSMTVGPNGQLYVLSPSGTSSAAPGTIAVFSATANGTATPVSFISGASTQLTDALSIAIDTAGNMYVSSVTSAPTGAILVFPSGGTGNLAPQRVITSPSVFYGVAVDSNMDIFAVEDSPTAATAGSLVEFTSGLTVSKTISGSATGFFFGGGLRIDSAGNLFVVNADPSTDSFTLLAFGPTASGNITPAVSFSSTAWNAAGSELAIH